MKIKRFELNNIREVILQIGDTKGPIKTQYKLVKLKKIADEEQQIYQDLVDKNCLQFLKKDENGELIPHPSGGYTIQEDKIEECNNTIAEILDTEIEINDITFTLDELEGLGLSLAQMEAMMAVIEE
jgi:hypothetical protein